MMRRTILLMATMALTLLVASGVALAVTKIGNNGPDTLKGTNGADNLLGRGGPTDVLSGGDGNDVLDPINRPAGKDLITCGDGFDRVLADRLDVVAPDCERVAVGLAAVVALDQRIEESGFYDRLFEGLAPFPEG